MGVTKSQLMWVNTTERPNVKKQDKLDSIEEEKNIEDSNLENNTNFKKPKSRLSQCLICSK